MFKKINVLKIIRDHFATFRSLRTGKIILLDYMLFVVIPLAVGIVCVYHFDKFLDTNYINMLIASLSILAGFLFNLLAIIFAFMDKLAGNARNDDVKVQLVKEIHSNISFSILLSIFCIIFLLFCDCNQIEIKKIANSLAIAACLFFFLTLLMILKRMYIVMSKELGC